MNKAELIRQLINDRKITLKAFSKKAGIPYTTLRSMLERGIENASVNNVIKVCAALDISIEYLYNMEKSAVLSYEETELLKFFNNLNGIGKKEAVKRVCELTQIDSYKINTQEYDDEIHLGMAAHNDYADDPDEQRLMREDLNEL